MDKKPQQLSTFAKILAFLKATEDFLTEQKKKFSAKEKHTISIIATASVMVTAVAVFGFQILLLSFKDGLLLEAMWVWGGLALFSFARASWLLVWGPKDSEEEENE